MTEQHDPRVISPREAERWWIDTEASLDDLLHTVATEPERTKFAVLAALDEIIDLGDRDLIQGYRDGIEKNGLDLS